MVQPQSLSHPEQFPQTLVSVRGQTVIPRGIRRLLNITPGSHLSWEVHGQVIIVHPVSEDPVSDSVGVLAGRGLALSDLLAARSHPSP